MSELIQRIPPNSLEAEQSVLGAMLLDKEAISSAAEILQGEDFYREVHKEIFQAIVSIYNDGAPVDLITLTEKLKGRNTLEAVGGISYLTQLMNIVPTTHNVAYYAKIVEEKSLLRKLIKSSNEIISKCYDNSNDPSFIVDEAEKGILTYL